MITCSPVQTLAVGENLSPKLKRKQPFVIHSLIRGCKAQVEGVINMLRSPVSSLLISVGSCLQFSADVYGCSASSLIVGYF